MTIENSTRIVRHIGNGVATSFPYTFLIPNGAERVYLWDTEAETMTLLSEPAYSITGLDDPAGGAVTYNPGTPIASTKWLIIAREVDYEQLLNITTQLGFFPNLLEDQLDQIVMQIQQVAEETARAIKVLPGEAAPSYPRTEWEGLGDAVAAAEAAQAAAAASEASALAYRDAILAAFADNTPIDIKFFGAKGDGKYGSAGAITATDNTFTDAGAAFTTADVGKLIRIDGAGAAGAKLVTTIALVTSATEIELTTAASTTVAAAKYTYGTDDTVAIDAAFQAIDDAAQIFYNTSEQRNIVAIGNAVSIRWTGGYYMYNGAGFQPAAPGGRTICIRGDGVYNSIIEILSDAYLIDIPVGVPAPNSIYVDHLKVCGGKGLYMNRQTTAVPQGFQGFDHVTILNHSEYAIFSYWGDSPRWWFTNGYIETTRPNAKGIYLPIGVANPDLSNTTICGCRYRIVTADDHISSSFISGLTMFSIPNDGHEADIWIMPNDAADFTQGLGTIITGNRMSNENRNGKPVVLIARPDGVGALETQNHATTTGAFIFRDMLFVGNVVTGAGTPDTLDPAVTGPLIRSYATDIGRMKIQRNSINVAFTVLLELMADPTNGYASDLIIGPNSWQGAGDRPLPCNKQIGIWLSDDGEEIPSQGTPQGASGGYDNNYTLLSVSGGDPVDEAELTLGGSTTRVAVTDALGGTNAREYTFTTAAGTDFVSVPLSGIGFTAAGHCYFDLDIKQGSTLALTEVDVEIVITTASGNEVIRRSIQPTADWLAVRIPFQHHAAMTGLSVRLYPSADSFSAGVRTKVQMGRPHVYRANRPVNRDHLYIANHTWDAGRERWKGPEASQEFTRWIDWTNSEMRAKFASVGASEADGASLLIPMMASAGAGVGFTPTVAGGTSAGVGTYTANAGRYFKLGKLIVGFGRVVWTAHTGTGVPKIVLGALPLCRNNADSRGFFFPIWHEGFSVTAGHVLTGYVNHNTNEIILTDRDAAGDALVAAVPAAGTIYFAFAYEAA